MLNISTSSSPGSDGSGNWTQAACIQAMLTTRLLQLIKEVSLFGETYTTNGHRPSKEKIKAIQDMLVLTNVMELQIFLGMCQYLAKYSARTDELSELLWQLTCKDTPFTWGPENDEPLKALKKEISAGPTLRYYDPHQPLVLCM